MYKVRLHFLNNDQKIVKMTFDHHPKSISRRLFIGGTWTIAASLILLPGLSLAKLKKRVSAPVLTVLERTTEPLLKADRPWEDYTIGFNCVLRIGDQWHLWYVAYDHNYKTDNDCFFCYAISKDGIHWEKPSLGIHKYDGSTDNNILMSGFNLCSIIYDEKAPPGERFKGVGARQHGVGSGPWWVYGAISPDGIHWKPLEEPLLKKNSDTGNICLRDGNIYRLYVRMWSGGDFKGYRIVGYTESKVFGDFPDPVAILSPDKDDPADLHFYNSATTKINDHLYLMFPSGFYTKDGTVVVFSAFSRNGKLFSRIGHKPLLGLGSGFDKTGIYVSAGAIPGEVPGTYWIYYGGTEIPHDESTPSKVKYNGGIGRFLLKVVD